MNSDAMQLVPNEQLQRTSTQQVANNSHSGDVIASLQPPVPQQGGPFPFFDAPEVAQPAGAHGSGSRKGHEDQLRVTFGPRAFHWAKSDSRVLRPIIRSWRDSGCDTIKADLLEVLPIAIPERTRFVHTVERGYLQLLDFAVDMLPVRDALTPFLQSMAELLNASNPSDEARTIRIPPDLHQCLMAGASSLAGLHRQEFDVTRKVRDIQF